METAAEVTAAAVAGVVYDDDGEEDTRELGYRVQAGGYWGCVG